MTNPNAVPAETEDQEYRTLAYELNTIEYVVLLDERVANIRLVHLFKEVITPIDWLTFEKQLETRMIEIERNEVEFELNSLQACVDLYDRKIDNVQIWTREGGKWTDSGRTFPLEKVPMLEKQKAINGLTRVEQERIDEALSGADIDAFLSFYSEPAVRLEAVQNDRMIRGLVHTFRNPTTNDTRAFNSVALKMRTLRGTRQPTTILPPNLKEFAALYDRMIVRISGYTFDGAEITTGVVEMNPYHKKAALQALFKGGSLKRGE